MRRIIKKISFSCLIFCTVIFSFLAFGILFLPENIVVKNGMMKNKSVIYSLSSVAAEGPEHESMTNSNRTVENEAVYTVFGIFPVKDVHVRSSGRQYVVPSGQSIGLKLYVNGAVIVGLSEVNSDGKTVNPGKDAGLQTGDIIKKINNTEITNNSQVASFVAESAGNSLDMEIERNGEKVKIELSPVRSDGGTCKAGLWIRDSFAGIGTMTFYTDDSLMFAGLGHPVVDVDTEKTVPISDGEAVLALINGCRRGTSSQAGELYGSFTDITLGSLYLNTDSGIYGHLNSKPEKADPVPVAVRQEIKTGYAEVLTTVDENGPKYYDIKILKLTSSGSDKMKNMIIEITDEELISKTGGIVQGMSGSPIIQDGKFVGAVTHVFVNDPTKGYAIFAENMLSQLRNTENTTNSNAA